MIVEHIDCPYKRGQQFTNVLSIIQIFVSVILNRKPDLFRIDTGDGIYEFSIDTGEVVTEVGNVPISEIEIELYSGETEEMIEIGEKIQKKYGLEVENKSKYARGLELIEGGNI